MNIPIDLKYTKDHEWVKIDGDTATIGITDFAQGELGDIVYVDVDTLDETVDKDEVFGTKEKWNNIPNTAINETGGYPIDYRVVQIKNCDFFIGLSSGLSWLAWALNKKVVIISGCTNEDNEFKENCYRVINKNVCNGCLNDSSLDNQTKITTSWMYCPRDKNFECSKEISFEMVKEKIDQCIKDLNKYS